MNQILEYTHAWREDLYECSLLSVRLSESYVLLLFNSSDRLILSSSPHSCKNYPQKHRKQDKTFQSSEKQDVSTHSMSDFKVNSPARPLIR